MNLFLTTFFLCFGSYICVDIEQEMTSSSSAQMWCKLPLKANPWDASLAKFIKRMPSSIKCPSARHQLISSTVDKNGVLVLNSEEKRNTTTIKCYFSTKWTLSKGTPLAIDMTLDMDSKDIQFVHLKCFNSSDQKIYSRTHYFPSFKPLPLPVNGTLSSTTRAKRLSPPSSRKQEPPFLPNVLFLTIESLSRLNFLRFMPKTKAALEAKTKLGSQRSHIFTLKGLTKIGDNTRPNMLPLLAGRRLYFDENPNVDENEGPFDELPFVWKDFKAKGYLTAVIEDELLFKHKKQPVDWYPWPILHRVPYSKQYCCYNKPNIDVLLDQVQLFLEKGLKERRPTFTFSLYSEVTHNDFNKAQLLDTHLASFVKALDLGSTLFVLMGDHGNRYGPVLETQMGRIEERMPLFTLLVPDYLITTYPSLGVNLKTNEERLTTWLDVHRMLTEIPSSNYTDLRDPKARRSQRAYSLWREEVPKERTCNSALIPETFCVCKQRREIDVSLNIVRKASRALVRHLNRKLVPYFAQCATFDLSHTKTAHEVLTQDSRNDGNNFDRVLELVVKVNSTNGVFRGQVSRRAEDGGVWRQRGDLTRISRYFRTECMRIKRFKPYCNCRKRKSSRKH